MNENEKASQKALQQKQEQAKKIICKHNASNIYLDLANLSMGYVPSELLTLSYVEHLYLEGNCLEELPNNFFRHLPRLQWLDLRNNNLTALPSDIGNHSNLKNVLLEKNQLSHLPKELGNLRTLTGLSLRGNPLVLPPPHIVEQGVQVIMAYLRDLDNTDDAQDFEEMTTEYIQAQDMDFETFLFNNEIAADLHRNRNNIPSPLSDEMELKLHGLRPVQAKFHHPQFQNGHELLQRQKQVKKLGASNVKPTHITFSKEDEDSRSKEWLTHLMQRKKDAVVLDEWRNEAKQLQRILLPRSKTDISHQPLPPYGIDGKIGNSRPVTREEQKIHLDSIEEKVDRFEPKDSKPKSESVSQESERLSSEENFKVGAVKVLPKINHVIIGINNLLSDVKSDSDRKSADQSRAPKDTEQHKIDRERIDSEVQARIRLHTSQLHSRRKKDRNEVILQPGRELQRELLDEKMKKNPQLEYRFCAFTGDTSSYTSSNKTSSL